MDMAHLQQKIFQLQMQSEEQQAPLDEGVDLRSVAHSRQSMSQRHPSFAFKGVGGVGVAVHEDVSGDGRDGDAGATPQVVEFNVEGVPGARPPKVTPTARSSSAPGHVDEDDLSTVDLTSDGGGLTPAASEAGLPAPPDAFRGRVATAEDEEQVLGVFSADEDTQAAQEQGGAGAGIIPGDFSDDDTSEDSEESEPALQVGQRGTDQAPVHSEVEHAATSPAPPQAHPQAQAQASSAGRSWWPWPRTQGQKKQPVAAAGGIGGGQPIPHADGADAALQLTQERLAKEAAGTHEEVGAFTASDDSSQASPVPDDVAHGQLGGSTDRRDSYDPSLGQHAGGGATPSPTASPPRSTSPVQVSDAPPPAVAAVAATSPRRAKFDVTSMSMEELRAYMKSQSQADAARRSGAAAVQTRAGQEAPEMLARLEQSRAAQGGGDGQG